MSRRGTALAWRRTSPALHEQGPEQRSNVNAFSLQAGLQEREREREREGLHLPRSAACRCDTRVRWSLVTLTIGRQASLSRSHSEGFGRGTGRQQRVAERGRALMQRFCQVFVCVLGRARRESLGWMLGLGGRRQRRGMLVYIFFSRRQEAAAAVWTGGDYCYTV
jgi:hypothetical protein